MSAMPTPPVVEPVASGAPELTPADYKAMYEAEAVKTADLIKQRNFLKPAQRMLEGLDEAARDELIGLGQLAAKGDREAMIEWTLATAEGLSGKQIADLIAERQTIQQDPASAPAVPGLTREEAQTMVQDALRQDRQAAQGEARVRSELTARGYDLDKAAGRVIIDHAVANNLSITEAADWFESDMSASVLAKQQAAAAAAATVPGLAPNGVPAATVSDRKPNESDADFRRRSIEARLKG